MTTHRYTEQMHAVVILFGAMMSILHEQIGWLLFAGIMGFGWMIAEKIAYDRAIGRPFGLANVITGSRSVIVMVTGIVFDVVAVEVVGSMLIFSLVLDGVDGYVARLRGEESSFGGRFDGESDAFFAAVVSFILLIRFDFAPFILIPGLLRYYFVLIKRIFGLYKLESPSMVGVKLLAVFFLGSLIAPFLLPNAVAQWVVWIGSTCVVFSFGREFALLWKAR